MSKMIPLHIADQAVAACEAEIQKLREENARLKQTHIDPASVIRLVEDGRQNRQGTYDTKHIIEVNKEAFERISRAMIEHWRAAKKGKPQP